jgi:DNA-binding NtrC family response regulator
LESDVKPKPLDTALAPDEETLLACWSEEPSSELDGPLLRQALVAASCLSAPQGARPVEDALRELLRLSRGERAYIFDVLPAGDDSPEPAGCTASLDLDGDPVSQAERKIPREVLAQVARSRLPHLRHRLEDQDETGRGGSLLVLPVVSRDRCLSLIAIENRFQRLSLERRDLRIAFIFCRVLGAFLDLLQLLKENDSLWHDLNRLRDSRSTETRIGPSSGRARPAQRGRREGLKGDYSVIVGSSPKMLEIFQVIDRISSSNAPVLVNGESGTGKELIALAVHNNSPRRGKTFVSENCGAITETLLESELFGYVKGAFTGAAKDHKGLFELAVGGTLFLDEVGDMSPSMQKKFLRVLQEGIIRRVGAKDFTPVNVRIISATNKDLMAECRAGNFREDLYYRLNVINLKLPPLRERRDDVPELVETFLEELSRESGRVKRIDPQAMQKLVQYSWPGNVRELQNEIKKLFALSDGDVILPKDLSEHFTAEKERSFASPVWEQQLAHMTLREATEQLEEHMIRRALNESGGNKTVVARSLQIPKTSLYNKLSKYKLA